MTGRQLEGLVGEVMTLETMVAALAMLTLGSDIAEELGDPLDADQRKALTREVLGWAAGAITRIDQAHQAASILGQN